MSFQECLGILYVPPQPPSIHFRAYAAEVDGFTLLQRNFAEIAAKSEFGQFIALCHDDVDRRLLKEEGRRHGVPAFQTQARTKLGALADLAAAFGVKTLGCFTMESLLCPASLASDLLAHHLRNGNHYTRASGLSPEIIDAAFAIQLASAKYVGDPPDLEQLIQALMDSSIPSLAVRAETLEGVAADIPLHTLRDADRCRRAIQGVTSPERFIPPVPQAPPPGSGGLRLLYVSPASGFSGAGQMLRTMIEYSAASSAVQMALLALEGVLSESLRAAGCHVICPNLDLLSDTPANLSYARTVLDATQPDVVHWNSAPGPAILRAVLERCIPTVTHVRGSDFTKLNDALRASQRIIAVSEFVRARLIADGLPPSKIHVVYDGVDSEALRREYVSDESTRKNLEIEPEEFVVLLVARLSPQKRHDLVIDAVAEVARHGIPVRLLLVGDRGDTRLYNTLCRRIAGAKLEERVLWLPFRTNLAQLEAAADVCVLCSDNEALGTCVLESMALEVPVIVSRSGGLPEMIEDGVTGCVVPPGDAHALAEALLMIRNDKGRTQQMTAEARRQVKKKFEARDYARAVREILEAATCSGERTRGNYPD